MYMRITRGGIDPAKFDEADALRPDLVAAIRRLPGYQSYMIGADRTSGRTVSVSTWDTEDHARFSADADAVRDVASRLQALGLQVEPSEVYEVTTPA